MAEAKLAERPAATTGAEVLTVKDLQAWYGESHILHGINFGVKAGEVVTLLGRNGAGKTTTLKSVMGIIGKRSGSIRFNNEEIIRTSSDRIARKGIAFCPEERGIFLEPRRPREPDAAADGAPGRAVARADLHAVSESEGASHQPGHQALRRRAADAGDRAHPAHRRALPDAGRADRRSGAGHHPADRAHHCAPEVGGIHHPPGRAEFRFASTVADRYYIVEHGKVIDGFANSELSANMDKLHTYLGV